MSNIEKIREDLASDRKKRIQARADQLIAAELSLQSLRQAHKLTQKDVAKKLGVTQDQVSKIEKRSDLLISTLRKYVQGMGGELLLMAKFRDQSGVILNGIGDTTLDAEPKRAKPHKTTRTSPSRRVTR